LPELKGFLKERGHRNPSYWQLRGYSGICEHGDG